MYRWPLARFPRAPTSPYFFIVSLMSNPLQTACQYVSIPHSDASPHIATRPSLLFGGIVPTFAASLSIPRLLARYVHACVPSRCRRTSFVHCLSICDLNSFNHHFLGIGPSISFHLTFRRFFIPVILSYLGVTVCVCLPLNLMLSGCYF